MKIRLCTILPELKETYAVREKSWFAILAAKKLRTNKVAIVWGSTVHLHGTSLQEFLGNMRWVRHELCHIRQFRQYGLLRFAFLYLVESIRKGYYHNRFEAEARMAESGSITEATPPSHV